MINRDVSSDSSRSGLLHRILPNAEIGSDDWRRRLLVVSLLAIGIPVLVALMVHDAASGTYVDATADLAMLCIAAVALTMLRQPWHGVGIYRIVIAALATYLCFIVANAQDSGADVVWVFVLSLVCAFVLGHNEGAVWSAVIGLAIRGQLTSLYNRAYMSEHLRSEAKRASRYGQPLSIVLCDIDSFKLVNDVYGHQAGDAVLIRVAGHALSVTMSAGAAEFFEGVAEVDQDVLFAISAADPALYTAKSLGKNSVVASEECQLEPLQHTAFDGGE